MQILPGVYLLDGLWAANVYLIEADDGLTLIDTGLRGAADKIAVGVESTGHSLSAVRSIILTHGHFDHTGNAAGLALRSGAAVLAHRADVPYIERTATVPLASGRQRILNWFMERRPVRPLPCRVDRALADGDIVPGLGGLRVIHTPGHTPGSICLYQPDRHLLFSGDALLQGRPPARDRLRPPAALFSGNMAQGRESLRRLAGLPLAAICFGHGRPLLHGAGEQFAALLANLT